MAAILLKQQQFLFDTTMNAIQTGKRRILISGPSGCGKSFLSNYLCTQLTLDSNMGQDTNIIHLLGDNHCPDRDYYPFQAGLNHLNERYGMSKNIKTGVTKTFDFLPVGGSFFEFIADALLNRNGSANHKLNQLFGETEIDIILKLRNAQRHNTKVIYIDNLHWWDSKSLDLLYLLFKHMDEFLPDLKDVVFICNTTTNQHYEHEEQVSTFLDTFQFQPMTFGPCEFDEYCENLKKLGLIDAKSDSKVIKLLFAISEGHMEITRNALSLQIPLKSLFNDSKFFDMEEGQYLRPLLEKRLLNMGATGQQIDNVLRFGALLGLSFTYSELEHITEYGQAELRSIISRANGISLVESNLLDCQFSHEVIREFFRQKALEQNEGYYYDRLVQCYKELYPTEYKLRIRYLLRAGDLVRIETLYCLDIVTQMESGLATRDQHLEVLLSHEIKEYIDIMVGAWMAYKNSKYEQALKSLRQIEDLYPLELLAERDYLLAIVMTRSLTAVDCISAHQILSVYEKRLSHFSEQQIWSKIMLLLFATQLHAGHKEDCRRVQKMLYAFYSKKAPINEVYRHDLNVLRRKSIAIFELEISLNHLCKSVRYFQPKEDQDIPVYPREYLMSLVNYNANLLCLGHFEEAYKWILKAILLTKSLPDVSFPRTEVAYNNFLLSCYFTGQLLPDDVINLYESLLSDLPDTADKTIIKTNLSIACIKAKHFDKAEELLTGMRNNLLELPRYESSYLYHVEANLVALYLCKGDWSAAGIHLEPLGQLIPHSGRKSYYIKKHSLLAQMIQNKAMYQGDPELMLLRACPTFQNSAWNFFGRLFAYNTLEYWSES